MYRLPNKNIQHTNTNKNLLPKSTETYWNIFNQLTFDWSLNAFDTIIQDTYLFFK